MISTYINYVMTIFIIVAKISEGVKCGAATDFWFSTVTKLAPGEGRSDENLPSPQQGERERVPNWEDEVAFSSRAASVSPSHHLWHTVPRIRMSESYGKRVRLGASVE
jgi:hypothetical protein